jgi:hypothetical protein
LKFCSRGLEIDQHLRQNQGRVGSKSYHHPLALLNAVLAKYALPPLDHQEMGPLAAVA